MQHKRLQDQAGFHGERESLKMRLKIPISLKLFFQGFNINGPQVGTTVEGDAPDSLGK